MQTIKPVGTMKAPKKPWEKAVLDTASPNVHIDMSASTILDPSFPPLSIREKETPSGQERSIMDEKDKDETGDFAPLTSKKNGFVDGNGKEKADANVTLPVEDGVMGKDREEVATKTMSPADKSTSDDDKNQKDAEAAANG